MTDLATPTRSPLRSGSWLPFIGGYAVLTAASDMGTNLYLISDHLSWTTIYTVRTLLMVAVAVAAIAVQGVDSRLQAVLYGLGIGFAGFLGQAMMALAATFSLIPGTGVYAFLACAPVVTVLLAFGLLRERLSPPAAVGVGLTILGGVLLEIQSDPEGSLRPGLWVPLVLIVAVMWGVQFFLMRKAATAGVNAATLFAYTVPASVLPILTSLFDSHSFYRGTSGGSLPHLAVASLAQLAAAVAPLVLLMAMARGKASTVAPVSQSLPVAVMLGVAAASSPWTPSGWMLLGGAVAAVGWALILVDQLRRRRAEAIYRAGAF